MDETEVNKGGRPKFEFTEEQIAQIKKLAEIHCTIKEIGYVMDIKYDMLRKYAMDWIEEGKSVGKIRLRRAQWQNALDEKNVTMQIWLGKNILGQSDGKSDEDSNIILPWDE